MQLEDKASSYTKPYYFLVGTWVAMFGLLSFVMGYEESFLWFNEKHNAFFDSLMPHLTHLGQGVVVGGLVVWLMARKDPAWALSCIVVLLLLIPLVGLLKTQFFADWHRPLKVFENEVIHYVSLRKLSNFSFPSGHSAGAVASLLFATRLFPSRNAFWVGLTLGCIAVLAAFTRVYIGAHFPGDIAAGMGLGLLAAIFGEKVLYPFFKTRSINDSAKSLLVILGIFTFLFGLIVLANTFYLEGLKDWDTRWLLYINAAHSPFWDTIMKALSAKETWLWVPIALLAGAYWRGGWKLTIQVGLALAFAILFADRISAGLFKPWIARFRPCQLESGLLDQLHMVSSCGGKYGFVSSHASNFFAIALMTALAFKNRLLSIVVLFLAAAVAYSRVYLGVHYPGDVLAGALLGVLCGYAAWWIGEKLGQALWKK